MDKLQKEKVVEFLKNSYEEGSIHENVGNNKSDYLPAAWEEEFDDEEEAYEAYGSGEAEAQERMTMEEDIFVQFFKDFKPNGKPEETQKFYERYLDEVGEEVWETIYSVYSFLEA